MAEHDPSDVPRDNPQVEHEQSDFSFRWVLGVGFALIVGAVLMNLLLWWMFDLWSARPKPGGQPAFAPAVMQPGAPGSLATQQQKGIKPLSPQTIEQYQGLPPEPRLEGMRPRVAPPDVRQQQQAEAAKFGWVDRQKGIVRIPVDLALDLAVKKIESTPAPTKIPQIPPMESNSGRIYPIQPDAAHQGREEKR